MSNHWKSLAQEVLLYYSSILDAKEQEVEFLRQEINMLRDRNAHLLDRVAEYEQTVEDLIIHKAVFNLSSENMHSAFSESALADRLESTVPREDVLEMQEMLRSFTEDFEEEKEERMKRFQNREGSFWRINRGDWRKQGGENQAKVQNRDTDDEETDY